MLKSCAWLVAIIPDGLKVFWAVIDLLTQKTRKVTKRCCKRSGRVFYSKKRGWVIDLKWECETIQEEHRD